MPTKAEIRAEVDQRRNAQDTVRRSYIKKLADHTKRDVILYASGWTSPQKHRGVPPGLFSLATDDVQGFMAAMHGLKGDMLDLVIHSPGGSLEAAEQIVTYLRSKYSHIRAIIPHNAMSAATMLAMACDEIILGKQSALGPIDPQIQFSFNGNMNQASAKSMLDELEQAEKAVAANPVLANLWAPRLRQYPAGIFQSCKTVQELAEKRVTEWLEKWMLAGEDPARAKLIAEWLADAGEHMTHGRPIGYEMLKAQGVHVYQLEDDQDLQDAALSVFHASAETFESTNCVKIIESSLGRGYYMAVQPEKS